MADFCEHGFKKGRRCPQCSRGARPGRRARGARSVYEDHDLLTTGDGQEESGTHLGSIDPVTGRASVDYSLARRWRPLAEFLWRR